MVPYMKGMSESCKNICRKHGVEMHFRRRQYHQGPPAAPQRQGHYTAKEWSDLQVQVWKDGL